MLSPPGGFAKSRRYNPISTDCANRVGHQHHCLLCFFLFLLAVPAKSELAVEIMEKGQVRFWMQAEKLSGNAKVTYIFNDKEIFEGPVGFRLCIFKYVIGEYTVLQLC